MQFKSARPVQLIANHHSIPSPSLDRHAHQMANDESNHCKWTTPPSDGLYTKHQYFAAERKKHAHEKGSALKSHSHFDTFDIVHCTFSGACHTQQALIIVIHIECECLYALGNRFDKREKKRR